MKTVSINKGNWSGEETKIKLNADKRLGSIPEYDLKFRLVERDTVIMPDVGIDETTYEIELLEGNDWRSTDWIVTEDRGDNAMYKFMAANWDLSITREDEEDARLAVAKLIFMLY